MPYGGGPFFETANHCGSFDYNCDGLPEQADVGQAQEPCFYDSDLPGCRYGVVDGSGQQTGTSTGWVGVVPPCGATGQIMVCGFEPTCLRVPDQGYVQRCR